MFLAPSALVGRFGQTEVVICYNMGNASFDGWLGVDTFQLSNDRGRSWNGIDNIGRAGCLFGPFRDLFLLWSTTLICFRMITLGIDLNLNQDYSLGNNFMPTEIGI